MVIDPATLLPSSAVCLQQEDINKYMTSEKDKPDPTHLSDLVRYLDHAPLFINIPSDFARPAASTNTSIGTVDLVFDASLVSHLALCIGGDTASCLISVFAAALHLFAACQEDFLIYVPQSNQNTLPLRVKPQAGANMHAFHGSLHRDLEFLAMRQEVSLSDLTSFLNEGRGKSDASLVQASFSFRHAPDEPTPEINSDFACVVELNKQGAPIGSIAYDSRIFAQDTAASFSSAFTHILVAWAKHPKLNLSTMSFPTSLFHLPSLPCDLVDISFGSFLAPSETKYKNNVAVIDDTSGTSYTYEQVFSRARRIQRYVRQLQGSRVGGKLVLLMNRSIDVIAVEIGASLGGVAFVTCDINQPARRIVDIISDAQPLSVVAHQDVLQKLELGSESLCVPVVLADAIFQDSAGDSDGANPDEHGELAYMIYTSGSTGKPKGVSIGHRSMIAYFLDVMSWVEPGTPLNGIMTCNIAWDVSLLHIYAALATGGCVKIPKNHGENDAEYLSEFMNAYPPVNYICTTAAGLRMWLDQTQSQASSFFPPGMVEVMIGGDRVPIDLIERAFTCLIDSPSVEVRHTYGPTEGTIFSSYAIMTHEDFRKVIGRKRLPIQLAMPHVSMTVVGPAGNELPRGFVGEIVIWGPCLMLEYHNRPDLNAQRFLTRSNVRGWRSGDWGRHLPSGEFEVLGRMDSMRKIKGGFRVELAKIETHIQSFSEVDKCYVSTTSIGDSDAEDIVAHVVFKEEGDQQSRELEVWQQVFVEEHHVRLNEISSVECVDHSFDYGGWVSALGRRNFTREEMTEWIDAVITRLTDMSCFQSAYRPRVLEIGSGTGMILFRLAELCESYTAVDFMPSAVTQVREHARRLGLANVKVYAVAAHEFVNVIEPDDRFDLIICNSVVMYFPSLEYLETVTNQAGDYLAPGGTLFFGDVRNGALLPQFAAARAVAYNPRSVRELSDSTAMFARTEYELLVDPAWFIRFARDSSKFDVAVAMLKRGNTITDMTLFRYDVVLQNVCQTHAPSFQVHTIATSEHLIAKVRTCFKPALFQNLENKRIAQYHYLSAQSLDFSRTLDDTLTDSLEYAQGPTRHHPEEVIRQALADSSIRIVPLCSLARPECFDLLVVDSKTSSEELVLLCSRAHSRLSGCDFVRDTRVALNKHVSPQTLSSLYDHLSQRVPSYMIPGYVVPIDSLPLTTSHKIHTAKLPKPSLNDRFVSVVSKSEEWSIEDETRRPILEAILGIFSRVLFADRPMSPTDNFFLWGGHSLIAAKATSLIRRQLNVQLPFAAIIAHPTARQLAIEVEMLQGQPSESRRRSSVIPLRWTSIADPRALVFVFPFAGGELDLFPEVVNGLDDGMLRLATYGLTWEPNSQLNTLEKITEVYTQSIAAIAGSKPTFLVGWCYGGYIATCVARRLPNSTTKVILLNSASLELVTKEQTEDGDFATSVVDYICDLMIPQSSCPNKVQRMRSRMRATIDRETLEKELREANIDRHDVSRIIKLVRTHLNFPEWVGDSDLRRYILPLADSHDIIDDIRNNYKFTPADTVAMESQVALNLQCEQQSFGRPIGLGWNRFEVLGSDRWSYGYLPEVVAKMAAVLRQYVSILESQPSTT